MQAIGGGAASRRFRPNTVQTGADLTDHRVGIRVHAQALQVLRDARGEAGTAGAGVVRHEMQHRGDQRFRTGRLHSQEFAGVAGLCFPPNIDQAIHNPGNNTRA